MEVTESYRVLELEIGAPRAVVDAAYCRLLEHWHPDRAASAGPEAVREAQRMVQAINDAYQTLAKIAPTSPELAGSAIPPPALNPANHPKESDANPDKPTSTPSTSADPATPAKIKPRLVPLSPSQTISTKPPPPPPPAETWAARTTIPTSATLAPLPTSLSAPPPPPPKSSPPPPPPPSKPLPSASVPLSTPPVAPPPPPPPTEPAAEQRTMVSAKRKVPGLLETLLPAGSSSRRFAPVIIVAALIVAVFLGKCAFSSSGHGAPAAPDPKTTGRLIVKSNISSATFEATFLPPPGSATAASFNGTIDQPLSGLPPGKYAVTAQADGWEEIHTKVDIEAEQKSEITLNFKGGSLHLNSDPDGATVRLGTAVLGRTPFVITNLPPGVCQLSIEYPSWPAVPFKTTIIKGQEATGSVRLPHGKLIIETSPPGTTVLLAGHALGQTPLTVDRFPAGTRKITLQAKDFPRMEISVTMEDRGELKIHPALGAVFPVLDPAALLRAVWVRDNPDQLAPPLDGVTGAFQSRNGVVKNLNRKWLFETWMRKRYGFTGIIKAYDPTSGQIEFAEQQSDLSKYRVIAILSNEARNDPTVTTQLTKGATFALYGQLSAVEEPRWPSKVITLELSLAEPLR